ncbi:MAG: cardiolipin synthase, partial [Psychrobacillus psychrotolerans]
VNAFIYDRETSHQLAELFEEDMKLSTEMTAEIYEERSTMIKFKESLARLISPIL